MSTINLRKYYPFLKEDCFVEVSDEVAEAFLLAKRQKIIITIELGITKPITLWIMAKVSKTAFFILDHRPKKFLYKEFQWISFTKHSTICRLFRRGAKSYLCRANRSRCFWNKGAEFVTCPTAIIIRMVHLYTLTGAVRSFLLRKSN